MIKITCTNTQKEDMIRSMADRDTTCPFQRSEPTVCIGDKTCKECINKNIKWEIIDD